MIPNIIKPILLFGGADPHGLDVAVEQGDVNGGVVDGNDGPVVPRALGESIVVEIVVPLDHVAAGDHSGL